jgi:hypothetical protein
MITELIMGPFLTMVNTYIGMAVNLTQTVFGIFGE